MIAEAEGKAWIGWPLIGPIPPSPSERFLVDWEPSPEDDDPVRAAFLRWDPGDRRELGARSAEIHAWLGDTLGALHLCVSAGSPATPLIRRLLAKLSRWEGDRGPRSLPLREAMSSASIAAGITGPAADHPSETFWAWNSVRLPPVKDERGLGRMLGLLDEEERKYGEPGMRSRILQGRARLLRRFGRVEEAEAALDRAESLFVSTHRGPWDDAGDVWWQRGMTFEADGRWRDAFEQYVKFCRSHAAENDHGFYRAGLMALMLGEPDTAVVYLERGSGEGAQFWLAVALRRSDPKRAEGLLHAIARAPGYSFYEVAARETLGVRGWPIGEITRADPGGDPGLILGRRLLALGATGDAARLSDRWAVDDARIPGPKGAPRSSAQFASAAELCYADGRLTQGIARAGSDPPSPTWGLVPWQYPPLHEDTLQGAARDHRTDIALMQSLAWQEVRSSFPVEPTEGILRRAPEWAGQLHAFGDVPVALAAYTAGTDPARRWLRRVGTRPWAMGGPALACELVVDPSVSETVKSTLGVRAAYAELRPTSRVP
jgi:hypothetical protein